MFIPGGSAIETGGYNINNSLRLRSSASASLTRTFGTPTSGTTWTMSFWFKRGVLGVGQELFAKGNTSTQPWTFFYIDGNGALNLYEYSTSGTSPNFNLATNAVFRDPSSWYHIVVAVDTTQATAANRQKVYVNGVQQTFSSSSYYPQNTVTQWNSSGGTSYIGRQGGGDYLDGYLTEINFIDGQQLTPSSFGATDAVTGVWAPKAYTGTYGTNGFYLKFSDIATTSGSNAGLGKDFSGNGNYWTTNNISVTAGTTYDAMTDSPTLTSSTVANYCTMNPLESFTNPVPQQANLYIPGTEYSQIKGTMWVSTGKWYFEWVSSGGSLPPYVGISNASITSWSNVTTSGISWYGHTDSYYKNFTATSLVTTSSISIGDVIGVAFDCDAGTVAYYKNNSLVHTDTTLTPNELVAPTLIATFSGGGWSNVAINFGQRPFTYTPPSGFKALNTFNLPNSTIVKGNTVMDATAYTGTNGSPTTQVISSNFQPDFLWFKKRSASYDHALIDTNRGINKQVYSNLTNAEGTDGDVLTAIGASSFTVGNSNYSNYGTLVAWTWKANGGTTSSNTAGSITSTVQANTTAGFSIVTYTGNGVNSTVGHGLGVAPRMIILKNRTTGAGNGIWRVYHASLGGTQVLNLNETTAAASLSTVWNNTNPTSSVFSVGITGTVNDSGNNYVAYCWAEIAGFSRFGSYTGNSSSDGPFVYLGFRPKFVMVKRSSSTGPWEMLDATRNTFNITQNGLRANASDAEQTGIGPFDFLSNGFKLRGIGGVTNDAGTFIYMAFAENPFKNALAR